MRSHDIMNSGFQAYKIAFDERAYLLKLCTIPLCVKLICFFIIMLMGWEQMIFRQAVVLIPSYFADGWMLSHIVRLVFYGQKWPFRPSGDAVRDVAILSDRAEGILKGTACFVVIKYLLSGITASVYLFGEEHLKAAEQEPSALMFFAAIFMLAFFFWAFRLLWLYIPAALGISLQKFMSLLGGLSVSWSFIGVWLVCFVPGFFVLGQFVMVFFGAQDDISTGAGSFVVLLLHVLMDTVIAILTTIGISYLIKHYIFPDQSARK